MRPLHKGKTPVGGRVSSWPQSCSTVDRIRMSKPSMPHFAAPLIRDRLFSTPSSASPRGQRWIRSALAVAAGLIMLTAADASERQLTHAPTGHVLTNVNVWSPDGRWIVYDTRIGDAQFTGTTIEQVQVATGEVRTVYTSQNGAACGVVTAHPREPQVVFIHGPEHPTPDWTYAMSRRRGVVVDTRKPGMATALDAATYAPPFVPGALRGGSHVHVFSPDGAWVSFTYDDEVLARLGDTLPATHDLNQRNVGVAVPVGPVKVGRSHPRNHDGEWFSVVVTRTVNQPRAGSDEISRACEEGWAGNDGYRTADGKRQRKALAFQGTVTSRAGTPHAEVFIVDLPEVLTIPGNAPLEGTATTRPAPPRGVVQRRLTFTDDRAFPGVVATPRHWLRTSPDGKQIAFLLKDDRGVVQLWSVSPQGGPMRQITQNPHDIASAFTWSPDGRQVAHVMDRSVCVTDVTTGKTSRLTPRHDDPADAPKPFACVFSPDGRSVAYTRSVPSPGGRFDQIFVTTLP